jgi:hypothetical protein
LFIPSLGGNFARARRLCDGCSVRTECLAFAGHLNVTACHFFLADEDLAGDVGWDHGGGTEAPEGEKGSGVGQAGGEGKASKPASRASAAASA